MAHARSVVSAGRVAHAGNGNSTTSGTGISGWLTNIVPGLAMRGPLPVGLGQEAVLGPRRLGRVEPADDPDRRVGDDAPLDLARGLLRADQDDAEAAAALGDVEQDLLDRRAALARRVLVELVEHDEQQRPGGAAAAPCRSNARCSVTPDDEALRPVGQVVEVDDGDLRRRRC